MKQYTGLKLYSMSLIMVSIWPFLLLNVYAFSSYGHMDVMVKVINAIHHFFNNGLNSIVEWFGFSYLLVLIVSAFYIVLGFIIHVSDLKLKFLKSKDFRIPTAIICGCVGVFAIIVSIIASINSSGLPIMYIIINILSVALVFILLYIMIPHTIELEKKIYLKKEIVNLDGK